MDRGSATEFARPVFDARALEDQPDTPFALNCVIRTKRLQFFRLRCACPRRQIGTGYWYESCLEIHMKIADILLTGLLVVVGSGLASGREATAIFAGGCFWCMEPPFDELEGVIDTTSGYTGGTVANPTYEQVTAGNTGHYEAVRVTYDTDVIDYARLLEVFWRNIDPLDAGGQFCDRGERYRSAIFYSSPQQKMQAETSKRALETRHSFTDEIVTPILEASPFYEAEEYHQNYYEKNPLRYRFYRLTCGRDGRLEELWGE